MQVRHAAREFGANRATGTLRASHVHAPRESTCESPSEWSCSETVAFRGLVRAYPAAGCPRRGGRQMSMDRADLVVVGAGTVGGWAAYFARQHGAGRVVVLEQGLAGQGASSRAAGIVRAQGGTPATVALGRWSIDFYRRQHDELGTDSGFRELGYLILAVTEDDERAGHQRVAMQQTQGLGVR